VVLGLLVPVRTPMDIIGAPCDSKQNLKWTDAAPFAAGKKLGEALLVPPKIYVKEVLAGFKIGGIKALAHITGAGCLKIFHA